MLFHGSTHQPHLFTLMCIVCQINSSDVCKENATCALVDSFWYQQAGSIWGPDCVNAKTSRD
eukprot:12755009-Prorocentrum_lima.AAC.1